MKLSTFRQQAITELTSIYGAIEARAVTDFLLEVVTGLSLSQLSIYKEDPLSSAQLQQLAQSMPRLVAQEPVQYVTGKAFFWDHIFEVSPAVLIPRQETEELVHWVIQEKQGKPLSLLDIGTGSGCIAISLAKNLAQANIQALDNSQEALAIARRNAEQLAAPVGFFHMDILQAKASDFSGLDVIVSNPPYIRMLEKAEMATHVLAHEPSQALFVPNDDPLIFYRKIAEVGIDWLASAGEIFVEINESFGKEVVALFQEKGYQSATLKQDLNQKNRMVHACK